MWHSNIDFFNLFVKKYELGIPFKRGLTSMAKIINIIYWWEIYENNSLFKGFITDRKNIDTIFKLCKFKIYLSAIT